MRARIAEARGLVDEAVAAAAAGDRERAYDIARTAYLDHFELAEVPLRLRDPNLVLDLEFSFAELRNGIRDGAPMSEIRSSAAEIRTGLVDVDRVLADKGFAAPLLAFTSPSRSSSARESRSCCCSRSCSARSARAGRAATAGRSPPASSPRSPRRR